jgi:hypothetical protein
VRHIGDVSRGMGNPQPRGVSDPYAGGFMTKHGWLSYEDIGEAGGRVVTDARGNRVIQFPYAYSAAGNPMYREIPDYKLDEGVVTNGGRESRSPAAD